MDDIINSLDIILEDLSDEQKDKLAEIGKTIKNPNNLTPQQAQRIVRELGIDIEAMQKKVRRIQNENNPRKARIPRNGLCPCGSQKKYKKCCLNSSI